MSNLKKPIPFDIKVRRAVAAQLHDAVLSEEVTLGSALCTAYLAGMENELNCTTAVTPANVQYLVAVKIKDQQSWEERYKKRKAITRQIDALKVELEALS